MAGVADAMKYLRYLFLAMIGLPFSGESMPGIGVFTLLPSRGRALFLTFHIDLQ
jgi:hypothetical protein